MSPIGALRGIKRDVPERRTRTRMTGERCVRVVIPAAAAYDGATI